MDKNLMVSRVMEKKKQLKIPYQNLLVGYAKEWIIEKLLSEKESLHFYLKRASQIGVDAYRTSYSRHLYVCVVNFSQEENALEQYLYCTFENIYMERVKEGLSVLIKVPFDKVEVDIRLHLSFCDAKKAQSYSRVLPLIYEENREIEIACFYPEAEIVEIVLDAFEKMDLFTDMEALEVLYQYATTRNMNGKYLSIYLEEAFKDHGYTLNQENAEQFLEAMGSKVIHTRFKGYLRSQKRKEPDYDTVFDMLQKLFTPVIGTLARQEIFFGDWMAELGRYL